MATRLWNDFRTALAFLTILPVGSPHSARPADSFAYYPLVGLLIGGLVAATTSMNLFPADRRAFLALLVWVVITGGLHLDGFGDACDGLLATVAPERRLEIMKDARAGSWAVVGLILLLLGKWIALQSVEPVLLILPPVMGRWAMVLAAESFPYARPSGMGGFFRTGLGRIQVAVATTTALAIAGCFGWPVVLVALAAPGTVLIVGGWAARRLGGGLTGDVYGALGELTEWVCLLVLGIEGMA